MGIPLEVQGRIIVAVGRLALKPHTASFWKRRKAVLGSIDGIHTIERLQCSVSDLDGAHATAGCGKK